MKQRILKIILVSASIAAFSYAFYITILPRLPFLYRTYFPCTQPIRYSLGSFDARFGMNQKDFLAIVKEAEEMWEKPVDKNLLEYEFDGEGNLKINLVYDYRQEATKKIHDVGLTVKNTRESYDALRTKYDALNKSFAEDKSAYQNAAASFKAKQDAHNKEVNEWNKKGGAPEGEYKKLKTEQDFLDQELSRIRRMEQSINQKITEINDLVAEVNESARALNLNADILNTIGQSRGEEFTEGEYRTDATLEEIDIYEFSTREKLKRVLAHELGHALGLDHVEDPQAVMYKLNQGTGSALSGDDLQALKAYCKVE